MRAFTIPTILLVGLLAIALSGCTKSESGTGGSGSGTEQTEGAAASGNSNGEIVPAAWGKYDLDIPMVTYQWDPQAGDRSVSAELGDPGFTGEGSQSNMTFPALGVPEAVKGGTLVHRIIDWPATLRMAGQHWNQWTTYMIKDMCYSNLLRVHPATMEYIPSLATHWWVSEDKLTYRFRINPAARWNDGSEVTAADYVATWKLRTDETMLFPMEVLLLGTFTPKVVSKYIIEVSCQKARWDDFYNAIDFPLLAAKDIGNITGTEYLDKFQFSFGEFCGPYRIDNKEIKQGESIRIRRDANWWDASNSAWVGLYNIDTYKLIVINENQLAFEKAKRGELDFYLIQKSQWYAVDIPESDAFKRGLAVRQTFMNDSPIGTQGLAINTQRPPLDDLRIRKTLVHLYDRRTMIKRLFYDQYQPMHSYWQSGSYTNPNNRPVEFDELRAEELLIESGWKQRNAEGYRVKDGKVLEFDLSYRQKATERSLTIFQEDCRNLGVKLNLKQVTPSTHWKNVQAKEFDLALMAWGATIFPSCETTWHGSLADKVDNNNITAFKNERVDELIRQYKEEYDQTKRALLVQEMDGIIFAQHPYVLDWFPKGLRVLYSNKFGMPQWAGGRLDFRRQYHFCWWVDPAKEKALGEARKDSTKTLPVPEEINAFWPAWNSKQRNKSTAAAN